MSFLNTTILSLLVLFFTIKPIKIKKVWLNMATASVIAIFVLLLTDIIDLETIKNAIIGNGSIEPWKIIIIFFTVAYVSISTDITGIFDYLACQIVKLAKGDGLRLFLFFYLFAGGLSILTSNDIVILTLTPIIFYLYKHAKINVIPLLFAEFFAANTLAMFLYIDNPTNIIMVSSTGIGFLEYLSVMWFPTIVASVTNYFLLRFLFRKSITKTYKLEKSSQFSVRNWVDAILSGSLMILMFIFLVLSDGFHWSIWKITLFFAVLFIIEDLIFSIYYKLKSKPLSDFQIEKREVAFNIPREKNEFWLAIKEIPWKILPFVATFFVIVYFFNQIGVIDSIASFIASKSQTLFASIGISGIISFIVANIINNQPMAIFFSHIFSNSHLASLSDQIVSGGVYAAIISSDLAANFTIVGALSGLMWKKILKIKGIEISYWDFFKKGIIITPIVFLSTLLTLYFVLL